MTDKQKYIGESQMKDKPIKPLGFKLKEKSVKKNHLSDEVSHELERISDLQNQIDSIQIHGLAVSNEYGDDPNIGISQKFLSEAHEADVEQFNYIQQQIDDLKGSKAVVNLTVNPPLIEVGQATILSFNATSDETASLIEVFAAGELIKSAENVKTLNGVIANPFISGQPGELEVVANFTYPNTSKSASAVITSVLPIYYGSGEGYAAANIKAPLSTTPAGTYQVNVAVADKYVYFVIPEGMTIHGAKMGGFDFPLEAPEPIIRGGKPYKGYRSCNTYNVGTLTIEIL